MKLLKNWKNKYYRKIYLQSIGLFLLFAIPVLAISIVFNKVIEAVFLFISFITIRYSFPKTFHSTKYMCIFYSIMMFTGMIYVVLPIGVSLVCSVFVSSLSCYILYLIKDYSDLKKATEKTLQEMTDEEFKQYCRHKGLTEQQVMIAECIYRKSLKGQDLYKAIGYSCRQTQRIRKEIAEKLENGTNKA